MGTTTSGVVSHAALKAIADRLRDCYGAERVLVYGSVACGTPTEHSDIDLLVVAQTTERFYERMGSALAVITICSRAGASHDSVIDNIAKELGKIVMISMRSICVELFNWRRRTRPFTPIKDLLQLKKTLGRVNYNPFFCQVDLSHDRFGQRHQECGTIVGGHDKNFSAARF